MKNKNGYAQKSAVQTKALESLQRRALCIIYEDGDYMLSLIRAGFDTLPFPCCC